MYPFNGISSRLSQIVALVTIIFQGTTAATGTTVRRSYTYSKKDALAHAVGLALEHADHGFG